MAYFNEKFQKIFYTSKPLIPKYLTWPFPHLILKVWNAWESKVAWRGYHCFSMVVSSVAPIHHMAPSAMMLQSIHGFKIVDKTVWVLRFNHGKNILYIVDEEWIAIVVCIACICFGIYRYASKLEDVWVFLDLKQNQC